MLVSALPASSSVEASPPPPGAAPAPVPAESPAPTADAPVPVESPTPTTAPTLSGVPTRIVDLAVAADNPEAAPVISLTVEPADSVATLWWRAPGADWTSLSVAGGSAMRLARLPDGLQRSGFAFYVDVVGGSGRARLGSRAAPIDVAPAVEGNRDRSARDARDAAAWVGPHPALIMIALGTGVIAGAGAGAFAYDLNVVNNRIAAVDAALAAGPADEDRAALQAERTGLDRALLQDTTATVLLGVVGGVALTTGVVLLVVGAVAQE